MWFNERQVQGTRIHVLVLPLSNSVPYHGKKRVILESWEIAKNMPHWSYFYCIKGLNTLPCPASSHRLTYSCSSSRQIMAELACFHFWKSLIMARKLARPASFFLVEWSVRPVVSHTRSASNWDSSPSLLFDPKFMDYPRGAPTSSQQGHLTPPCYHHHWQRTHERTHASRLTPEKNLPGRGSQAFFLPWCLAWWWVIIFVEGMIENALFAIPMVKCLFWALYVK